ncbi:hypothetical protein ARMSODRAFT_976385 [Armillaria solidipes]|uniref:Uncharacterized protein n=1 Tax=Armillaria solidipes TaxID=1076256 RepID=A0A2H3BB69_9AGAR|nr:hypothetical protein ARMSODRAFT_976385 [Armillaria solidipes]
MARQNVANQNENTIATKNQKLQACIKQLEKEQIKLQQAQVLTDKTNCTSLDFSSAHHEQQANNLSDTQSNSKTQYGGGKRTHSPSVTEGPSKAKKACVAEVVAGAKGVNQHDYDGKKATIEQNKKKYVMLATCGAFTCKEPKTWCYQFENKILLMAIIEHFFGHRKAPGIIWEDDQGATNMKKNDMRSIKKFRALALDLPTST